MVPFVRNCVILVPLFFLHVFEHFNLAKTHFCLLTSRISSHIPTAFSQDPVPFSYLSNHASSILPPQTFFHYFKYPPTVRKMKQINCLTFQMNNLKGPGFHHVWTAIPGVPLLLHDYFFWPK